MHWRATENALQNLKKASCPLGKERGKYFVFENVIKIGHNVSILLKNTVPIN